MNNKISVIIPVYNSEKQLPDCIDSIRSQTYPNLEIILVNDGSTDSSAQICDAYEKKDSRIKTVHKDNEGTSIARNIGLKLASGDFIGFVDSDDKLHPTMYEKLLNLILQEDLEIGICSFQQSTGRIIYDNINPIDGWSIVSHEKYLNSIKYLPNGIFNVWNKLFESKIIQGLEFIPGRIHQDALFVSEVYKRNPKIGLLNTPLYTYCTENQSITRSQYGPKRVEAIDVMLEVHQNLLASITKQETFESIRLWFIVWLLFHYGNLCLDPSLDNNQYRNKLKKQLSKYYQGSSKDIRHKLAVILPHNLYGYIHSLYMMAVKLKLSLHPN